MRPDKTDAGNGSYGICRVIGASRSPSPDPGRCQERRMKLPEELSVFVTSVLIASCATRSADLIISPSGRFRISYDAGTREADPYYEVFDRLERAKGECWNLDDRFARVNYSICSGAETPLDVSRVIWSPSDMTFLVMFGLDKGGRPERFLLVRQNDDFSDGPDGNYSKYWLVGMRALESRFFNERSTRIISVNDTSVSFISDNDSRTIQISSDALEIESRRQENQSDEDASFNGGKRPV